MAGKNKIRNYIFLFTGILIISIFIANWFLVNRMERILRRTLSERVAYATGGFYHLDFDRLNIGFFDGELTIKGIDFKPDSIVFNRWKAVDSIPEMYISSYIESIEFKGINLVWRKNYRELHFDLFEIQSSEIKIYTPFAPTANDSEKSKEKKLKTLHEMISPYIDVISVKKINLEKTSVSFTVEDPANPSVYTLSNANFNAFGFLLDKNSSTSGKLLYCDNFEFEAVQPQNLLMNNQLILHTDKIRLSTQDSIILISDIQLIPREELWTEQKKRPDNYLNAHIKSVEAKGIFFKRMNSQNYLNADSLNIIRSDIQYFSTITGHHQEAKKGETGNQSIDVDWSLYETISPVLNQVSIRKIGIEKAKFQYTIETSKGSDLYTLRRFDFHAYDFLIDSLSDINHQLWHSRNVTINASDIEGKLSSIDHHFNVGGLSFNMKEKFLKIEDLNMQPDFGKYHSEYFSGSIQSIHLDGIEYDQGVSIQELNFNQPVIKILKNSQSEEKQNFTAHSPAKEISHSPVFHYLQIKNIRFNNADISFENTSPQDQTVFHLPNCNVYVSGFLINEKTLNETTVPFRYDYFSFNFRNLDNILADRQHRLIIKNGSFSGQKGNLHLHDIQLLPYGISQANISDSYSAASIILDGIDYHIYGSKKTLKIDSLHLSDPRIGMVTQKKEKSENSQKEQISTLSALKGILDSLSINSILLSNAHLQFTGHESPDSIDTTFDHLHIQRIDWDLFNRKKLSLGNIYLNTPDFSYQKTIHSKEEEITPLPSKTIQKNQNPVINHLNIESINIDNAKVSTNFPDIKINIGFSQAGISNLKQREEENMSFFDLGVSHISKPIVEITQIQKEKQDTIKEEIEKKTSIEAAYDLLGGFSDQLSLKSMDIQDGNIHYILQRQNQTIHQKINDIHLYTESLFVDNNQKIFEPGNIHFSTNNFEIPLDSGFYTIKAANVTLDQSDDLELEIKDLQLIPFYPKTTFALHHPRHKDWFNAGIKTFSLKGIDVPSYLSENIIKANYLQISDAFLDNFKNQQIEIEHNIMPMIYEGLQKLPVKLHIDTTEISNLAVTYEELPKNGSEPGKIFFTGMNSKFSNLTNIVSNNHQYIRLDSEGNLMGTGFFTAIWMVPVDPENDHFSIDAHLHHFDLTELNQLITPMAPASVESGIVKDLVFHTDASSTGADINMNFAYNHLKINILNIKDDKVTSNKLYTRIANAAIKSDNPRKKGKNLQQASSVVERDPYHSTFNYIWQILQPPLIESVGISEKKQNFVKHLQQIAVSVKNFFYPNKKKK